jgi:hypothetical protein
MDRFVPESCSKRVVIQQPCSSSQYGASSSLHQYDANIYFRNERENCEFKGLRTVVSINSLCCAKRANCRQSRIFKCCRRQHPVHHCDQRRAAAAECTTALRRQARDAAVAKVLQEAETGVAAAAVTAFIDLSRGFSALID